MIYVCRTVVALYTNPHFPGILNGKMDDLKAILEVFSARRQITLSDSSAKLDERDWAVLSYVFYFLSRLLNNLENYITEKMPLYQLCASCSM